MIETKLGKITNATFGFGGYDGVQFGLTLTFEGPGWGVSDFSGFWSIERSPSAQWSEGDRQRYIFEAAWKLKETLEKAKKKHVAQLVGTPVEVTFDGNRLASWRVLEEVL